MSDKDRLRGIPSPNYQFPMPIHREPPMRLEEEETRLVKSENKKEEDNVGKWQSHNAKSDETKSKVEKKVTAEYPQTLKGVQDRTKDMAEKDPELQKAIDDEESKSK